MHVNWLLYVTPEDLGVLCITLQGCILIAVQVYIYVPLCVCGYVYIHLSCLNGYIHTFIKISTDPSVRKLISLRTGLKPIFSDPAATGTVTFLGVRDLEKGVAPGMYWFVYEHMCIHLYGFVYIPPCVLKLSIICKYSYTNKYMNMKLNVFSNPTELLWR